MFRQADVVVLLEKYGGFQHGVQARIARELGVSEATISRDITAIYGVIGKCSKCGGFGYRNQELAG